MPEVYAPIPKKAPWAMETSPVYPIKRFRLEARMEKTRMEMAM
jgi:hypothetical protein